MKYKDQAEEQRVNGNYVGVRQGTALQDAMHPVSDGYAHIREVEHFGTELQDTLPNNGESSE